MRVLALCLLSLWASAQDATWTRTDTTCEAAWQALNVVDWLQTRQIAKNPVIRVRTEVIYTENGEAIRTTPFVVREQTNLFLPKHPSVAEVNRYFVVNAAAHYVASKYLTGAWRRGFQMMTIGIALDSTTRNVKLGVKLRW